MAIFDFHLLNPKSHVQPSVMGQEQTKHRLRFFLQQKFFVAGVGARNGVFNR